jgi:hypothetical protein
MRAAIAALFGLGLLTACGSSSLPAVAVSPSPSIDPVTVRYVALVKSFWSDYRTAETSGSEPDAGYACVNHPDMTVCATRVMAMIPILEKFLKDLDGTPPPAKFATDDASFRHALPIAIADLKLVLKFALKKEMATFNTEVSAYINDMIPAVTGSLDHVDPSTVHN